jgi:hypothetical protein
MTFENAQPGEQYLIWVNVNNYVTAMGNKGHRQIPCTVIGYRKHCQDILVGWKNGERTPIDSSKNWTTTDLVSGHLDLTSFTLYKSCSRHRGNMELIAKGVGPIISAAGAHCHKCRDFNPYAIPNQADGSFVCYGCRS